MIAQFLKSKTINFAILLAVLGAIQGSTQLFAQYMSDAAYGWFTFGVGLAVAVLRVVTTTSIGDK